MEIKDFVEEYDKLLERNQSDFVKSHIIEKYISYQKKCDIAERIVNITSHSVQLDGEGNVIPGSAIHIVSASRYILFIMNVINEYTDLNVDFTNIVEQYDDLCKRELIAVFISLIGDAEVDEFKTVVQMYFDDLMMNEYEIKAYISNMLNRLGSMANILVDPIVNVLNAQFDGMTDIDKQKLANTITTIFDMATKE